MTLVLVALGAGCVSLVVAVTALTDAMQAGRRCDEIEQAVRLAQLDYKAKTAAVRRKGWETRRRKAWLLEMRQLELNMQAAVNGGGRTGCTRDGDGDMLPEIQAERQVQDGDAAGLV